MDKIIPFLFSKVELLYQKFHVLQFSKKFLDPFFELGNLNILVDDGVLKLLDLLVGIRVLVIDVLKILNQLGNLLWQFLNVSQISIVLISLIFKRLLKSFDLILKTGYSSLKTSDLSSFVLNEGL